MNFDKKNLNIENPEELFLVDIFSQITERLKQKYNYSDEEILRLWNNEAVLIPVAIFAGKLSPAEALTKLLNKKPSNIWTVHNRAKKKENEE